MDFVNILSIVLSGGGAISGIISLIGNRRLSAAQAELVKEQAKQTKAQTDGSVTDYVSKIIEQADKRVQQYEDDAKNWREKIVDTETYAKEQRLAFNALREEKSQLKDALHKSELRNKDLEHALVVAEWAKCTDDICKKRIPPRIHDKPKGLLEYTPPETRESDAVAATVNR